MSLKNKTIFITGSSRGIGRAIALKCASEGANVVITGKTTEPHPKLEGTIFSVAAEVEKAGGQALALALDVRDENQIQEAVAKTVEKWGGIDVLINNASAISISDTPNTPMKRFDLMMQVNMRATYACAQACLAHLERSSNPHILTLSPPLNLNPKWFKNHVAYTLSKYGMSMCTLGLAEEFKARGIAVNSLWPRTTIMTAAIKNNFPDAVYQASRKPEIMADAAYYIITTPSRDLTGQFLIDDEVLQKAGVSNLDHYALNPDKPLFADLFL